MFTERESLPAPSRLVPHQGSDRFSICTGEVTEPAQRSWELGLLVIALLESYLGHIFLLKCGGKITTQKNPRTLLHILLYPSIMCLYTLCIF